MLNQATPRDQVRFRVYQPRQKTVNLAAWRQAAARDANQDIWPGAARQPDQRMSTGQEPLEPRGHRCDSRRRQIGKPAAPRCQSVTLQQIKLVTRLQSNIAVSLPPLSVPAGPRMCQIDQDDLSAAGTVEAVHENQLAAPQSRLEAASGLEGAVRQGGEASGAKIVRLEIDELIRAVLGGAGILSHPLPHDPVARHRGVAVEAGGRNGQERPVL